MTQAEVSPLFLGNPILPDLDAFTKRLSDVWESRWITNNGFQLKSLEKRLAERLNVSNLVLFCNGTIALLVGLKALGIKGEVITTPFTFPATIHAIEWAGLTPVFADIDYDTLTLDPDSVSLRIGKNTSAILGVHVYGIPCHVNSLASLANRHGLKLIYDGAHAFDTTVNGHPIAHYGDITMFSFHATKLFHTGEGGALAFNDASLRREILLARNFGVQSEEEVVSSGINGKMSELHASFGHCVLDCVDAEQEARTQIAEILDSLLTGIPGVRLPKPPQNTRHSRQYYPVLFDTPAKREAAWQALRNEMIMVRRYFYPLGSSYPPYAKLPSSNANLLPVANHVAERILCLPCHSEVKIGDAERIARLIRSAK